MFIPITCPYCQETFDTRLDSDESSEFIIDCEVCCRPMTVVVTMQGGEVVDVQVGTS